MGNMSQPFTVKVALEGYMFEPAFRVRSISPTFFEDFSLSSRSIPFGEMLKPAFCVH